MKALVIVSRDLEKGSTKFRIVQFAEFLQTHGWQLNFVNRREVTAHHAAESDVVFNQKCLLNGIQARRIIAAARRVIFDFDDAIYTRPGGGFSAWTKWRVNRRFAFWMKRSDVVIAANEYLAGAARLRGANPVIVPMTLDLEIWKPVPRPADGLVRIGWAGSPANLPQLERLEPVLKAVLQKNSSARLAVFCGQQPRWSLPCDFHPFRPGGESAFVQSLDIGLLPLTEDEFTRGKSPIKSLQYLACGLPVVGNAFGATLEILKPTHSVVVSADSDWIAALEMLINDAARRRALGEAGRQFVLNHHDQSRVRQQLLALLAGN